MYMYNVCTVNKQRIKCMYMYSAGTFVMCEIILHFLSTSCDAYRVTEVMECVSSRGGHLEKEMKENSN